MTFKITRQNSMTTLEQCRAIILWCVADLSKPPLPLPFNTLNTMRSKTGQVGNQDSQEQSTGFILICYSSDSYYVDNIPYPHFSLYLLHTLFFLHFSFFFIILFPLILPSYLLSSTRPPPRFSSSSCSYFSFSSSFSSSSSSYFSFSSCSSPLSSSSSCSSSSSWECGSCVSVHCSFMPVVFLFLSIQWDKQGLYEWTTAAVLQHWSSYTVLYCTVLYCTVLYCTVLYCTVLYCTVLYFTVLYCTVLYCTVLSSYTVMCPVQSVMSCHVMSCHVMSCHVMSCHVMSCHVMSCHVMSCHVMSCYVMSCHVMLCHVMSCHVMSCTPVQLICHVVSCHDMSYNISDQAQYINSNHKKNLWQKEYCNLL